MLRRFVHVCSHDPARIFFAKFQCLNSAEVAYGLTLKTRLHVMSQKQDRPTVNALTAPTDLQPEIIKVL